MSAGISKRLDFSGRESSRIISAVAGSNYPASEEYPLTQQNFPMLLHAFTDDGIDGNNQLDPIGGVTVISSTGWDIPASGRFRANAASTFTQSGSWTAIGTKDALFICIGNFSGSTINTKLGTTGAGVGVGLQGLAATANRWRYDGSNRADNVTATASYPAQSMAALLINSGVSGSARAIVDGSGFSLATITGDVSQTWPAFSAGSAFTADATSFYTGVFLLAGNLSTFVDEPFINAALTWMVAHPKFLYPGFYHRS